MAYYSIAVLALVVFFLVAFTGFMKMMLSK